MEQRLRILITAADNGKGFSVKETIPAPGVDLQYIGDIQQESLWIAVRKSQHHL